jgi:hypothetical protein
MDRVKFVESLNEFAKERFISNCNNCNELLTFENWVQDKEPSTDGIAGAFVWSTTREGHNYWSRVNANIKYEKHEV